MKTARHWLAGAAMGIAVSGSGGWSADAPQPADPAWTDTSCGGCHVPLPGFSHPVDVPAAVVNSGPLPLSGGRITCITCHEPGSHQRHAEAAERRDNMLRGGLSAAALCGQCHDSRSAARRDLHGATLQRAHLLWVGQTPAALAKPPTGAGRMIDGSAECLSCHDGMAAVEASYAATSSEWLDAHPVGIEYRPERGGSLRPLNALDRTLVLPRGRVECTSCHSLYSKEPALLVMSNQRSALCLACHSF